VVRYLVERGANINVENRAHRRLLDLACDPLNGNGDVIRWLINHIGVTIPAPDSSIYTRVQRALQNLDPPQQSQNINTEPKQRQQQPASLSSLSSSSATDMQRNVSGSSDDQPQQRPSSNITMNGNGQQQQHQYSDYTDEGRQHHSGGNGVLVDDHIDDHDVNGHPLADSSDDDSSDGAHHHHRHHDGSDSDEGKGIRDGRDSDEYEDDDDSSAGEENGRHHHHHHRNGKTKSGHAAAAAAAGRHQRYTARSENKAPIGGSSNGGVSGGMNGRSIPQSQQLVDQSPTPSENSDPHMPGWPSPNTNNVNNNPNNNGAPLPRGPPLDDRQPMTSIAPKQTLWNISSASLEESAQADRARPPSALDRSDSERSTGSTATSPAHVPIVLRFPTPVVPTNNNPSAIRLATASQHSPSSMSSAAAVPPTQPSQAWLATPPLIPTSGSSTSLSSSVRSRPADLLRAPNSAPPPVPLPVWGAHPPSTPAPPATATFLTQTSPAQLGVNGTTAPSYTPPSSGRSSPMPSSIQSQPGAATPSVPIVNSLSSSSIVVTPPITSSPIPAGPPVAFLPKPVMPASPAAATATPSTVNNGNITPASSPAVPSFAPPALPTNPPPAVPVVVAPPSPVTGMTSSPSPPSPLHQQRSPGLVISTSSSLTSSSSSSAPMPMLVPTATLFATSSPPVSPIIVANGGVPKALQFRPTTTTSTAGSSLTRVTPSGAITFGSSAPLVSSSSPNMGAPPHRVVFGAPPASPIPRAS
jgi:hypothetical protein